MVDSVSLLDIKTELDKVGTTTNTIKSGVESIGQSVGSNGATLTGFNRSLQAQATTLTGITSSLHNQATALTTIQNTAAVVSQTVRDTATSVQTGNVDLKSDISTLQGTVASIQGLLRPVQQPGADPLSNLNASLVNRAYCR